MIVKWVHKPEDGWTKETLPEEGVLVMFKRKDAIRPDIGRYELHMDMENGAIDGFFITDYGEPEFDISTYEDYVEAYMVLPEY